MRCGFENNLFHIRNNSYMRQVFVKYFRQDDGLVLEAKTLADSYYEACDKFEINPEYDSTYYVTHIDEFNRADILDAINSLPLS
jgi:hypothetical protein